jgi:hypothetical protein
MRNLVVSKKALFALLFYVLIPIMAITTVMTTYPELSRQRLEAMLLWIIPVGIMLIIISQVQMFYEKGTVQHLTLNLVYVATAMLWIIGLFGGSATVNQSWKQYEFSLHVWRLLVLVLAVNVVNVFYYIVQYEAFKAAEDCHCDDAALAKTRCTAGQELNTKADNASNNIS